MLHHPLPTSIRWTVFGGASLLSAALVSLSGCDGGSGGGGGTGGDTGTGGGGGTSTSAGGEGGTGPVVRIHMRANTDPFPHDDGLAGQTPIAHSSGMRKFQLLKDASDPNPLTVFDYGDGFVEAGYNDGDDTVVGTVVTSTLPGGTYTVGRVVHSHVRYQVAATVHASGLDIKGQFDNVQVLSDGTTLDGVTYDHGHYEYTFHAGGQDYTKKGEGAPQPNYPASGGFSAGLEDGQWIYSFPVNLTIVPDTPFDVDMVMEVNMFESFRWTDQDGTGYQTGVFDVAPPTFEPVERFGANSFSVSMD